MVTQVDADLFDSDYDDDEPMIFRRARLPVAKPSWGKRSCGWARELPSHVHVLYVCTILAVAASVAAQPTFVLYFDVKGWTTSTDTLFYSLVMFANPVSTVIFTIVFGLWQNYRPSKELFIVDLLFTSLGYLIMALVPNRWGFLAGFVLSRIFTGQGSVRNSYLVEHSRLEYRTLALSLLPVASYLGALLGPFVTFGCSFASEQEVNGMLINGQTITLLVSFGFSIIRAPFVFFGFNGGDEKSQPIYIATTKTAFNHASEVQAEDFDDEEEQGRTDGDEDEDDTTVSLLRQPTIEELSASKGEWRWIIFFSTFLFLFQMGTGVYVPLLPLVLVNIFDFSQSTLSVTTLGIVIISMIAPMLMAFGSRYYVSDRVFLAVGLVGTLLPSIAFAWPTNSLISVLVGGVLTNPFVALVLPSANALLSKKLGPKKSTPAKFSIVQAISSVGYSVGALLSSIAFHQFGEYYFLLWAIPLVVVSLSLPLWWRFLIYRVLEPDIADTDDWKELPD